MLLLVAIAMYNAKTTLVPSGLGGDMPPVWSLRVKCCPHIPPVPNMKARQDQADKEALLASAPGSALGRWVPLLLSWPGAGVLVFWQIGVMKGLAARYDLSRLPMLGSSSGALVTALAKGGACMDAAAHRGIQLLMEFDVSSRPFGLLGILGRLTRQWMEDVLPDRAGAVTQCLAYFAAHHQHMHPCDTVSMALVQVVLAIIPSMCLLRIAGNTMWATCYSPVCGSCATVSTTAAVWCAAERCSGGGATLLVTTLPLLRTRHITDFHCRDDLMEVVMASSHIPVVVDWRMFVSCRWRPVVDGGLWWLLQRSSREYRPAHAEQTLLISPSHDQHIVKARR
ncbi:uncharacterized protein HaLaN_17851 [Haematococcus lacustris]|uniref:Patatin n=1 Tax=Haematococcus lacustris TaxID=44745 RepID=A0A699ZM42_HAELA|nr:uncharacterized protein HaLaN_17851 [Haematococcus lacustris]